MIQLLEFYKTEQVRKNYKHDWYFTGPQEVSVA
jgi:hypothetical protein